jgi:GT2 family glycosyltransferase
MTGVRPSVAIAVPSLEQGRFLGAALDSVLAQAGVDVRVAVLDAGSRDASPAVISRYASHLQFWRSSPDGGQAAAINEGIQRLPDTAYVGWLNADDELLPGGLARLAAHRDAHPDEVAAFGQAHITDSAGRQIGAFPTREFTRRALARTSIVCQPASLIRRRAWEAVGGLDESLHMCLDYDLWWRLSALGPIGYVREPIACSRDHDGTKTRAGQDRHYAEGFAVLRRHLGYVPLSWCVREAAYRFRQAHGGRRAAGPAEFGLCGLRAVRRFLGVNGLAGLTRAAGR